MRVAICTVGTRGDVQPLLAVALALQRDHGDEVVICTHDDFEGWIHGLGLGATHPRRLLPSAAS
jgi:vancomycin aglycone glucosyltransferase